MTLSDVHEQKPSIYPFSTMLSKSFFVNVPKTLKGLKGQEMNFPNTKISHTRFGAQKGRYVYVWLIKIRINGLIQVYVMEITFTKDR